MAEREFTLPIVGVNFPNEDGVSRRFDLALCAPGEPVELRAEPKNKHDEDAVGVFSLRGVRLGYVPADRAGWIAGKLRNGEEWAAIFQGLTEHAAWVRVRFGAGAPSLPPPRQELPRRAAENCDFYPDADGPEWGA